MVDNPFSGMNPTPEGSVGPEAPGVFGDPSTSEFSFDFTGADTSGNVIPDGSYEAIVIDVDKSTSKQGNKMWVWTLAISKGPKAGKEIKMWTALTPSALWKLAEVLAALGYQTDSMVSFKKDAVVGKQVIINVLVEQYNGSDRSSIKKVEAHPNGPIRSAI